MNNSYIFERCNENTFLDHYLENGYVCLRNAVDTGLLDELVRDLMSRSDEKRSNGSKLLRAIHQVHAETDSILSIVKSTDCAEALSILVGAHLKYWDGSVKMMQSTYLEKAPGELGYAWHQDENYIPTRDKSLTTMWVAIDHASVSNGCLWVVPKSHQMGFMYPFKDTEKHEDYEAHHVECFGFKEESAIPIEIPAGTAVFFSGYLLHCSKRNLSRERRRSFAVHFCNSWSPLPWRVEPGTHSWADDRGVQMVSGLDPYYWKGTEKVGEPIYSWIDD